MKKGIIVNALIPAIGCFAGWLFLGILYNFDIVKVLQISGIIAFCIFLAFSIFFWQVPEDRFVKEAWEKKWRVKYSANTFGNIFEGFGAKPSWKFWRDWKYYDTKGEAIKNIQKNIPNGGMGSQICCAFLYKRIGFMKYKFEQRYRRKSEYKDDGAYPTDNLESWNDSGEGIPLWIGIKTFHLKGE